MPMGNRREAGRRRIVNDGDTYHIDEEQRGEIELAVVPPIPDPPPPELQGEPWGWKKGKPYPRGWRSDGRYGPQNPDDPGPYDGSWDPPDREDR